ncbi:MAG: SEC-C domain-containing protein [Solirubrobacteraceae bacterium]
MNIHRNALCPCDSGAKLKHCCLDEYLAWQRAGNALFMFHVERTDGSRCNVDAWDEPIDENTTLIVELNPVTSSWVRNALPTVARFGHPGYRGLLLEHLRAMVSGGLPVGVAESLSDEFTIGRDYLTFELARPVSLKAAGPAGEAVGGSAGQITESRTKAVGAGARSARRRRR